MSPGGIYDIREDEVKIEGKSWNDSEIQKLVWKQIYLMQKMVDYWQPYLDRGEMLMDMYDGKILTSEQREIYETIEDKIVIEPPIAKAYVRTLLGQVIKNRKSGQIETEEGDLDNPSGDPNEIETIDICLKHQEKRNKEQVKIRDAIHDCMVSCYPNILLYQKRRITEDNPLKHGLVHPPWNSCVFGPINTREPDMSDIRELGYFQNMSMAQLIELYPKMKNTIKEHFKAQRKDDLQLSSIVQWDDYFDAEQVSYLNNIYNAAYGNLYAPGGQVPTFMRLFPMTRKEEVWINVDSDAEDDENLSHVVLPEEWSDKKKQKWIEINKGKFEGPYEKEIVTLWQCVFTSTGLMLSNKKHWYQEYGNLPAEIFLPCMINGKPSGPMVDMSSETLRNCIAAIEFLDDVRKGDGQLLITKAGALTSETMENITSEANKSLGVAIVSKDFPGSVHDAVDIKERHASMVWKQYQDYTKGEMIDVTRINEASQGEHAPRQSNLAKNNEIDAALVVNAIYFDNFNLQIDNLQNLDVAMIPYNYDESNMKVEAFLPNKNETKATTINVPQYDAEGDRLNALNDVTSKAYRWMVSPVDDSSTAKQRHMQDAINIINGSAGPLQKSDPSGKLLAQFWSTLDNPILHEAGKRLMQDVQMKQQAMGEMQKQKVMSEAQSEMMKAVADLEKAKKAGVALSFTGEQLAQYPNLWQLLQSIYQQNGIDIQQSMAQMQPSPPAQPGQPPQNGPQGPQGGGVPSGQAVQAA